jgi:co-chaperonin GroES (HSP10)
MKLIPSKEILICTNPAETKSKSGLIISSDEKSKKPEIGIIYAIGIGDLPLPVEVGDKIVFRRYSDNRIFVDGVEYNSIGFKDIVGVIGD